MRKVSFGMLWTIGLLGFLFAAIAGCVSAASSHSYRNPSSLASNLSKNVDAVFEQGDWALSPGCSIGIYQRGKLAYGRGFGLSDLESDVPLSVSSIFHVASLSKQFTAAAVILLSQQGKISLDDDIRRYLPELPEFPYKISVRDLIHHTSGLRDQWDLLELDGWRDNLDLITDEDIMTVVSQQRTLNFEPKTKFLYSNTGYTLLAQVVRRVTGASLREYTRKNIFEPLGMKNTHFRDDHGEIIKGNAKGYQRSDLSNTYFYSPTNFDTVGATSLHTTIEDFQLWDENFYYPKIGGRNFIQQMLQSGLLKSGEQIDYAFGIAHREYRGLKTIQHVGSDAGFRSGYMQFPEQHTSIAVFCNTAEAKPIYLIRQIADIVLTDQFKEPTLVESKKVSGTSEMALSANQLSRFTGFFWDKDNESHAQVVVKDGGLALVQGTQSTFLDHDNHDKFVLRNNPFALKVRLAFVRDKTGNVVGLILDDGAGKPSTFIRIEEFKPDLAELHDFTGRYKSLELSSLYSVSVQDGELN